MSSAAIKRSIKEFRSVTGCTESVASQFLSKNGQSLEAALNAFYSDPSSSSANSTSSTSKRPTSGKSSVDSKKLEDWFQQYKSPGEDCISDENLNKFFKDLGILESEQALTLVIVYELNCQNFGEISHDEFIEGMKSKFQVDSSAKLHSKLSQLKLILNDSNLFKPFYMYIWNLIKEDKDRKVVDVESVIEMWNLLLPNHFNLLSEWISFIKSQSSIKSISKDVWSQIIEFAKETKNDEKLKNYDEAASAWPVLIDEFVEWKRAKDTK